MTHGSIGLGDDGPTHQPIEHLISFQAMPNILMLRPADGNETAGSYKIAVLNRKRPSFLALSRQKLPQLPLPGISIKGVEKGGYVISDNSAGNKPDLILIVWFRVGNCGEGRRPVEELFDEQSDAYTDCPPWCCTARISIEAGATLGWEKYVGGKGEAKARQLGLTGLERVLQKGE